MFVGRVLIEEGREKKNEEWGERREGGEERERKREMGRRREGEG